MRSPSRKRASDLRGRTPTSDFSVDEPMKKPKIDESVKENIALPETSGPNYWLFKSEPLSRIEQGIEMKFSIDDLAAAPNQTSCWDGVRNYQARNMMRDKMKAGDLGFFYHSSCPEPGIVGIVKVTKESYPDHSSWNKSSGHFDPRSVPESPIWFMVDVQLVRRLSRLISLHELKGYSDELQGLRLIARGSRLSIQPVAPDHWHRILALE